MKILFLRFKTLSSKESKATEGTNVTAGGACGRQVRRMVIRQAVRTCDPSFFLPFPLPFFLQSSLRYV
jgi:hypothetical protein